MEEKIWEEFNAPDTTTVDKEYLYKLEENHLYCKKTIELIKEEVYGLEDLQRDYKDTVESVKKCIKDLEDEIGEI